MATPTLNELLRSMVEQGGSDLHVTTNSAPQIRVDGVLRMLNFDALTPTQTKQLAYSILTDTQKHRLEENLEIDFSFGIKGLARFRANVYHQRGAIAAAFRQIPFEIRNFRELGVPAVVEKLCEKPRGLVLVTGPTGSGKSTTLATMIDKVNRERAEHIVTIEDPVEYLHSHKKCIVNQRELAADTHSFGNALRSVLRQDPDVVLVGEMRDFETVESALRIAETGHLTFATLHTNSAAQTINRIVDIFPAHQQSQIRVQLSFVLEGILCQTLLPRAGGKGRVLAMEVLVPNAGIRNLIREDKIHQIYGMMQSGQARHGMQTFNQSLAALYFKRMITLQTAMARSSYPDELQEIIARGASALNPALGAVPGGPGEAAVAGELRGALRHAELSGGKTAHRQTQEGVLLADDPRRGGRHPAPPADRRHLDQGEGPRDPPAAAPAAGDRAEAHRHLHAAVLGDARRRPAARPVPGDPRRAGGEPGLRADHRQDPQRRRVGLLAGRGDAQAPQGVRQPLRQHDRRRRGGRYPRHHPAAPVDLHREGRPLKNQVKSALIYPVAVIIIAVLVVWLILWKVIPVFQQLLESVGGELPLITALVVGASNFVGRYTLWMISSSCSAASRSAATTRPTAAAG
jgi:twitching motility protein PilT